MKWFNDLRWRFQVWRNRLRHPGSVWELMWAKLWEENPLPILQEMMMRDREVARAKGIHPPNSLYPDLWDYQYLPRRDSGSPWYRFKRSLSMLIGR